MARFLLASLGLALLLGPAARALPRTPPITIDERTGVVEIRMGVPLKVGYDVSAIGGSGLRLRLFRFGSPADQPPVREWTLAGPRGPVRLSLGDLPVGVYQVEAVALGPDNQPVGSAARPLLLEYGGPGAWNSLPAEDLRNLPPAFEGVGGNYQSPGQDTSISVSPATPVVKPGGEKVLTASARGL
ncbi:MAG TPA: hypothetical protein VNO81_00565, partial [Candidatus Nitrosotenuis sp.]|nr:hypothetical protein [Candidatus Nitrosotenuis sp.]